MQECLHLTRGVTGLEIPCQVKRSLTAVWYTAGIGLPSGLQLRLQVRGGILQLNYCSKA